MKKPKYTIKNLREEFSTEKQCLDYLFKLKYKETHYCPKCGSYTKFYFIESKKRYDTSCGHSIYPKKDTIYYKSSTPLTQWFYAIYLFSVSKNGVSAKELERHLGVTYKTAWRIANKIRSLMIDKTNVVSGIVEMDETYIGGKERNKHYDKKSKTGFSDKVPVVGMKSREGKVVANVENNTMKKTLIKNIYNHIGMNSLIITDELPAYKQIEEEPYWLHKKINHSKKEYAKIDTIDNVKLNISTNRIENFWSVFKRGVKGTYIRLSKKWMQSYVNEFVFRHNNKDKVLFKEILRRMYYE